MRLHHFAVTLTGSAQPITTDKALIGYYVSLQPYEGNSDPVYVGGIADATKTQTVSATVYGIRLPAPDASGNGAPYPLDPWKQGLQVVLNDVWVLGTNAEVLLVSYWK